MKEQTKKRRSGDFRVYCVTSFPDIDTGTVLDICQCGLANTEAAIAWIEKNGSPDQTYQILQFKAGGGLEVTQKFIERKEADDGAE